MPLRTLVFSAASAIVFATEAPAQSCGSADQIIDLADLIIETRPEVNPLRQRQIGTDAAYMILRHGGLTPQEADALPERFGEDMPSQLSEVMLAYQIARDGALAALTADGGDALARLFADNTRSVWRAILLEDAGETFFSLVAQARAADAGEFLASYVMGLPLAYIVTDQDDAFKREMSANAQAAGEIVPTALLLADLETLDAYHAYIATVPEDAIERRLITGNLAGTTGTTLRHGTGPLREADSALYRIMRGSWNMVPSDFTGILYNQTGDERLALAVSHVIDAAIASGEIDPRRDSEGLWILAYRTALLTLTYNPLTTFDWPASSIRHYSGRASETLDRMVAYRSLTQAGDAGTLELPDAISDPLIWEEVKAAAEALAQGRVLEDDQLTHGIELLWLAGEREEALALATRLPAADRVSVYRDFMRRLDLACEPSASFYPGMGIFLGGSILYDFSDLRNE